MPTPTTDTASRLSFQSHRAALASVRIAIVTASPSTPALSKTFQVTLPTLDASICQNQTTLDRLCPWKQSRKTPMTTTITTPVGMTGAIITSAAGGVSLLIAGIVGVRPVETSQLNYPTCGSALLPATGEFTSTNELWNTLDRGFFSTMCNEFECRWPEGFVCPRCQGLVPWPVAARGVWECAGCRYQVSLTAGTVLHKTHTALHLWF